MADDFDWDVFIAYCRADAAVARGLAARLRNERLRVWSRPSRLRRGEDREARLEEGLERSRVLVLCLSKAALHQDWAQLEAQTRRFRDPSNIERGFIQLRLDDVAIPDPLAQFVVLDWQPSSRLNNDQWQKLSTAPQKSLSG